MIAIPPFCLATLKHLKDTVVDILRHWSYSMQIVDILKNCQKYEKTLEIIKNYLIFSKLFKNPYTL